MEIKHIVELLDNSQDAETIALEINTHPTLNDTITNLIRGCGYNWLSVKDDMSTIIRELWDIAYSHGYYDGKVEAEEDII